MVLALEKQVNLLFGAVHNGHVFAPLMYKNDWWEFRCVLKGSFDFVVPARVEGDWSGLKGDCSHHCIHSSEWDELGLPGPTTNYSLFVSVLFFICNCFCSNPRCPIFITNIMCMQYVVHPVDFQSSCKTSPLTSLNLNVPCVWSWGGFIVSLLSCARSREFKRV